MEIWAAIDLSGKEAFFSFGRFPEKKIISSVSFTMKGRDSSSLLPKIEEVLARESLGICDVSRWTAGTGPGNYTGLRIVSALVSGIAYGKEKVMCRGIPSALAMLSELAASEGENSAVLYPYDSENIFAFAGMMKQGRFFKDQEHTGIFSVADYHGRFKGLKKAFLEKDSAKMPLGVIEGCIGIPEFPAQNLVFVEPEQWDVNSVKDLIYIRPAVNVAPMHIRTEL